MNSLAVNQACKRLRGSGLTQETTHQVLNQLSKWVLSNGHEWTIQRLKALKTAYVHNMAGLVPEFPWIAHNGNKPKGVFRAIFGLKKPQKALSALMVYTSWVASRATEKQLEKFTTAVTSDTVRIDPEYGGDFLIALEKLIREVPLPTYSRFDSVERWGNRPGKRVPIMVDPKHWRDPMDVRTTESSREAMISSATHPIALDFFERFEREVGSFPNDISGLYASAAMQGEAEIDVVGKIGFIQEPGYKLRTVASPFPVFQLQLSRLANYFYKWLGDIPEDATFNQDASVREIQNEMRNNGTSLMSIDLSSATDRFPYSYTELMLSKLLGKTDAFSRFEVNLLTKISRGKWKLPSGETIVWNNGQPLGVYPSFAVFALSHHLVARSVNPSFYRILGDDIVIDREAGERLLGIYQDVLKLKISWDKTLDSPTLCEFGGRLITKTRIYATPKWADLSDRSFLDLMRNLGPTSLGLLKPRQKRIVRLLSEVPSTLHPLGLNWNPHGKPYAQRVEESLDVIQRLEKEVTVTAATRDRSDAVASMKESLYLRTFGDFHTATVGVGTGPESQKPRSNWSSVEDRILRFLGIESASFDKDEIPDAWIPREVFETSDPRGVPLLTVLERKLQGVRSNAVSQDLYSPTGPSL